MARSKRQGKAVIAARCPRLQPAPAGAFSPSVSESLRRIGAWLKTLPLLDMRAPDEMLGYDEHGLPR